MDVYGESISLHFQGYETYTTNFGAFCTMLTGLLLSVVFAIAFWRVFIEDFNPEISSYYSIEDLNKT